MPDWLTSSALIQWALYGIILLLTAKPFGTFLYRIFTGERSRRIVRQYTQHDERKYKQPKERWYRE